MTEQTRSGRARVERSGAHAAPRSSRSGRVAEAAGPWAGHVLASAAWLAVVAGSTRVDAEGAALQVALAIHLVGLVIGLGAVVLLDWYGLAWVLGRRSFRAVIELVAASHPLIWSGAALLLGSGLFLGPDLDRPLTWVKLLFVLVLLNTGVAAAGVARRSATLAEPRRLADLPAPMRTSMLALSVTSQASWWTAVVIGLLTTFERHGP